MPWLTIIMAVLAFFLMGGAKKEKRGKAALAALAVGAGTYYTTHHTEWGQENLGQWDGVSIGTDKGGNPIIQRDPTDPGREIPGTSPGGPNPQDSGSGSFWSVIGGWLKSPVGQVTTGAAGASLMGLPNWLVWGGAALAVYLLVKD